MSAGGNQNPSRRQRYLQKSFLFENIILYCVLSVVFIGKLDEPMSSSASEKLEKTATIQIFLSINHLYFKMAHFCNLLSPTLQNYFNLIYDLI